MAHDADTVHAAATVLDPGRAEAAAALADRSTATLATVLRHASIRRYAAESLPDDVLDALRAALVRGPTSSALHSYTHVLVRDPDLRTELARLAGDQPWVAGAPLVIVGCADLRRARLATHGQGYRYTAHDLRMLLSAASDLTVGIQNASLVAQSLGYGTVMLGGVMNGAREIADLLDLPSRVFPLLGLAVGRPQGRWPDPRPRLPRPLLLHDERGSLDETTERALLEEHDAETRERGTYEGRRIPWSAMGRGGDDPVPPGAYGALEHMGRKQGRATWGPQGRKLDADLAALGVRAAATGEVDPATEP